MRSADTVFATIDDLVAKLMYYGRKEDEELPVGRIEEMIRAGAITPEQMTDRFLMKLKEYL